MAKTKSKTRGVEEVRAELGEVQAQLKEWEAEESALKSQGELDWESAQDPGRLEAALEAERRLSQIPAQVKAGKIRATELSIELLELEQAIAQGRVEELHGEMEQVTAEFNEVAQRKRQAESAWHEQRYLLSDLRREVMRLRDRDLYQLKQGEEDRTDAPVVRSLPHRHLTANQETVVVPSGALEKHRNGGGGGS